MSEAYRLRPLKVSVAGHYSLCVLLRLIRKRSYHGLYKLCDLSLLVHQVKPHVKRHLIVPGARGVQLLAGIAYALREHLLHEHVDVLTAHVELKSAALKVRKYAYKAFGDLIALFLRDDALCRQHRRVRQAALYVLLIEPLVKAYRGVQLVRQSVRKTCCYPCPHLRHYILLYSAISCTEDPHRISV